MAEKVGTFPYFGGKTSQAGWIVPLLPKHKTYVEPFGGSAGILMQKEPSALEIYNDLDQSVVAFFRCLRDPKQERELIRQLRLTPWARAEHGADLDAPEITDVERARRFYTRIQMSFSAMAEHGGFKCVGPRRGYPAQFAAQIEELPQVAARLRQVVIESLDFEALMRRFDGPETCFYVDPPYYLSTLQVDQPYRVAFDYRDHARLICLLKKLKGKAVLSGYDCPAYNAALRGWRVERRQVSCTSSANRAGGKKASREEILWIKE